MRLPAVAITAFAALILSVAPVSAQLGGVDVQVFVSGYTSFRRADKDIEHHGLRTYQIEVVLIGRDEALPG